MRIAVLRRFVRLEPGYEIPLELGMFSEPGNCAPRDALDYHLRNLAIAEIFTLNIEAERLRLFLNPALRLSRTATRMTSSSESREDEASQH